jgi:macrolide transport system ATP-binding/permease protein
MPMWQWLARHLGSGDDMQEEIRSHLTMAAQDRIAGGEPPQVARLAALREFGNVTLAEEASRRVWRGRLVEYAGDVLQDVRYGVRLLARSPGFALVVISVLAMGIGANATVFSLFKGLALKPLPGVTDSARLGVVVGKTSGGRTTVLSYPDYQYIRDHDRAFSGLAGVSMEAFSLGLGTRGERVWGEVVTGNYFQVLGVRARLGRTLLPSDEIAPGRHPVAVIGDGLWRRAFGSDPAIIGKTMLLNAYPLTVVGVAAPEFRGSVVSLVIDVFVPVMMQPQLLPPDRLHGRQMPMLWAVGRPRPGISLETATAQMAVLSSQLAAENPLDDFSQRAMVLPMWRSPFGAQTYMLPAIVLLSAMGGLLLLIVCANVAGLVLVRGLSRRGEIAARLALGASRGRILRLLLIENLALAVPGAVAGLLLTRLLLPLLRSSAASSAPMQVYLDVSTDGLVVGFALLISCGSAFLFGFLPALQTSRVDLASIIKDDLSPRSAPRGRFRAALVVAQVAVSVLLLVGAGLVMRSLEAARNADAGFDSRNVASVSVDLKPNGYDEGRGRVFYQQLLDSLRVDDGISSASLAAFLPLTLVDGPSGDVRIEGYQRRRDEDLSFLFNVIAPDYFQTLRIGLVAGRDFSRRDDAATSGVAIVNEAMARRFWGTVPGALGKRLSFGGEDWRTVVGVARNVKYARLTEDPRPYVYLPFLQHYVANLTLQVRGSAASPHLLEQVRGRVQALDPNLPVLAARMLAEQTRVALNTFETAAATLVMFGVIAIGLAALGIYGLVSYTVKQSTHEIGIRMALGAQRGDVAQRFLGRGLRLGTIGVALGIAGSFAVTRLLATLLFGVRATDVVSYAVASTLVLGITLVASLIPAWKAARTNPIAALRHQ